MTQSTENKENTKVQSPAPAPQVTEQPRPQVAEQVSPSGMRSLPTDMLMMELRRRGVERFDPEETERTVSQNQRLYRDPDEAFRFDPPVIHDAASIMTALVNKDPSKKYVWVYKADKMSGFSFYRALGYRVEVYTENGVRPALGETGMNGEEIEFNGHVLMSTPLARYKSNYIKGMDFGGLGQEHWDKLEKHIRSNKLNPVRNLPGSQFMAIENTTTDQAVR